MTSGKGSSLCIISVAPEDTGPEPKLVTPCSPSSVSEETPAQEGRRYRWGAVVWAGLAGAHPPRGVSLQPSVRLAPPAPPPPRLGRFRNSLPAQARKCAVAFKAGARESSHNGAIYGNGDRFPEQTGAVGRKVSRKAAAFASWLCPFLAGRPSRLGCKHSVLGRKEPSGQELF